MLSFWTCGGCEGIALTSWDGAMHSQPLVLRKSYGDSSVLRIDHRVWPSCRSNVVLVVVSGGYSEWMDELFLAFLRPWSTESILSAVRRRV